MNISRLSLKFCQWLNQQNSKSPEENAVIKYGLELFIENITKLIIFTLISILIHKKLDSFIIFFIFCTFRLQAGGYHFKSNLGCTMSMFIIWGISLIANLYVIINITALGCLFIICFLIVLSRAPQSINIELFTPDTIKRKKMYSLIFLFFSLFVSVFFFSIRELIAIPIIFETLSLIPNSNREVRHRN